MEHTRTLCWNENTVNSPQVRGLLNALSAEYPIYKDGDEGLTLSVEITEGEDLRTHVDSTGASIIAGDLSKAARGIGNILAGQDNTTVQHTPFRTRGILLDACRGAVMKPEYVKQWLRRMALSGYNMLMIYTKDTYKLPGEEYFGYLRGAYTHDEMQEIDEYAQQVGIEVVGCIQALGHLEPVLSWPAYREIRDTISVLLTTEEKTYDLISKMLDFYSSSFASRRIHLGMDETHGLGRGRHMNLHGYTPGYDIYNAHLSRVADMCKERGLQPIIWSDMYFRLGSKHMHYYTEDARIPEEVAREIPSEVQLSYWDYYHEDEEFYRNWIRRHKEVGRQPFMASAIWTWPQFWYNHQKTEATITPCIEACTKENVDEIIFTMWGDDGGYCDWSSAWAGMCYAAERMFNNNTEPQAEMIEERFAAICGGSFADHLTASEMTVVETYLSASALLWDDPLLGIFWKEKVAAESIAYWGEVRERYLNLSAKLADAPTGEAGDIEHARIILALLELKIRIRLKLEDYTSEDLPTLREWIAEIIALHERLTASFRKQWYERCKTYGFEVIQLRLAGLVARYRELDTRLLELRDGRVDSIPELSETVTVSRGANIHQYNTLATAAVNSVTTL